MLRKVKRRIGRLVLDLAGKLGLEVSKLQGLDLEIRRLQYITDPETRLSAAEELVRLHPQHPKPHLELAQCLHGLSDIRQFDQMDRYAEVRREWLIQTGLDELDMEFIWSGMVVGSLGNHYAIEGLLKANQCGLRPARKPFLLLSENAQLRNPALFSYFEPHLHVVRDGEAIQALKRLESLLTLPLGLGLPMNDGCPFLDLAANRAEVEREKQGLEPALFRLSDRHRVMGMQALEKLGLPKDAWYVTLHVREPGYRGETRKNTSENWRNANPLDYLKAVEAVTKAGGWVFRMGDASMTPLPSMPGLIDYAHHQISCDWMDVFLGATCRFCIATASGYWRIPRYFGVPVIFTNGTCSIQYFSLMEDDLYLPRLLKREASADNLSFHELMSPPVSMFWSMQSFRNAGLHWVENTPKELEVATMEMLERTNGSLPSTIPDDDLQWRFKAVADACGLKYGSHPAKAFAPISRDFLERHADLL